jgi:hypothetical protein
MDPPAGVGGELRFGDEDCDRNGRDGGNGEECEGRDSAIGLTVTNGQVLFPRYKTNATACRAWV